MADFTQINDLLWVGGAITSVTDVETIYGAGVDADIDCRQEQDDQSFVDAFSNLPPTPNHAKEVFHYLYIGVPDDGQPKPVSWFEAAWNFAKPLFDQKISIDAHCAAGVNRGPSIGYFLLRAYWHMTGDDAFALLKQKRPQVNVAYRNDADQAITALHLG